MKRLVASIVVLSSTPVYFLFTPLASASEVVTVCKPVTTTNIVKNAAAHPAAYENGFAEGRLSASRGETYKPRSVGGEFARGFEDGYNGRRFTGQEYAVRDQVQTYTTQQCQNVQTNNPNVNPQVIPNYQTPPNVNPQVIPNYQTFPNVNPQVIPNYQTFPNVNPQVIPNYQTFPNVNPQVIPNYQTSPNVIYR
jgi:hypothetical protein